MKPIIHSVNQRAIDARKAAGLPVGDATESRAVMNARRAANGLPPIMKGREANEAAAMVRALIERVKG